MERGREGEEEGIGEEQSKRGRGRGRGAWGPTPERRERETQVVGQCAKQGPLLQRLQYESDRSSLNSPPTSGCSEAPLCRSDILHKVSSSCAMNSGCVFFVLSLVRGMKGNCLKLIMDSFPFKLRTGLGHGGKLFNVVSYGQCSVS